MSDFGVRQGGDLPGRIGSQAMSPVESNQARMVTTKRPVVAIVTQSFSGGGGVGAVSRWLTAGLKASNVDVRVFQLAAHRRDIGARALIRPFHRKGPMIRRDADLGIFRVGAHAAELEVMRYLPRRALTAALNECDVIQVVGGSPALGYAASRCIQPVFIQMATFVGWERPSVIRNLPRHKRAWYGLTSPAVTWVEKAALSASREVFVENRQALAELASRGFSAVLAPPGVDTDRFSPAEDALVDPGYILSVGRLAEARKGYERMIRAYAELRKLRIEAPRLVLAGQGQLERNAKQLVQELGLTAVVDVVTDVPEDGLVSLLRGASVFWSTSYEEGLGLSAVEALACGVPVVATDTAGSRMAVTADVGALVTQEPFDSRAFAQVSAGIINAGRDMRLAARDRAVRFFATEVTIRPYLDAYRRALSDRPDMVEW